MTIRPTYDARQLAAMLPGLPQFEALGVQVVSLEPRVVMKIDWRPDLVGNAETGWVHGGVITTLLDSLCGFVTFAAVPQGSAVATLDLRIDYLKPATPREPIYATGEVYRLTSSVAFTRAKAFQGGPEMADSDDGMIANCMGAFMVGSVGFAPDLPKPAPDHGTGEGAP